MKNLIILVATRNSLAVLMLIPAFAVISACSDKDGYSDLPNCKADVNCLSTIRWKTITPDELQVMIDAGADVHAKDKDGFT